MTAIILGGGASVFFCCCCFCFCVGDADDDVDDDCCCCCFFCLDLFFLGLVLVEPFPLPLLVVISFAVIAELVDAAAQIIVGAVDESQVLV